MISRKAAILSRVMALILHDQSWSTAGLEVSQCEADSPPPATGSPTTSVGSRGRMIPWVWS
jgi:hypothetical protein